MNALRLIITFSRLHFDHRVSLKTLALFPHAFETQESHRHLLILGIEVHIRQQDRKKSFHNSDVASVLQRMKRRFLTRELRTRGPVLTLALAKITERSGQ